MKDKRMHTYAIARENGIIGSYDTNEDFYEVMKRITQMDVPEYVLQRTL